MLILEFYRFMSDGELKAMYKEIKNNKTVHPAGEATDRELRAIEQVAEEKGIELE